MGPQSVKIREHFNSCPPIISRGNGNSGSDSDSDIDFDRVNDLDNDENFFNSLKRTLYALFTLVYEGGSCPMLRN